LGLALLLSACATPGPSDPGVENSWSGRLALRVDSNPPQAFSAGFDLRGGPDAGELLLNSPLGNTVASVRCGNTDVATAQVRAGLAWVYAPQAQQHPRLVALQRQARANGQGLWAQKRPLAPWDYRRQYLRP